MAERHDESALVKSGEEEEMYSASATKELVEQKIAAAIEDKQLTEDEGTYLRRKLGYFAFELVKFYFQDMEYTEACLLERPPSDFFKVWCQCPTGTESNTRRTAKMLWEVAQRYGLLVVVTEEYVTENTEHGRWKGGIPVHIPPYIWVYFCSYAITSLLGMEALLQIFQTMQQEARDRKAFWEHWGTYFAAAIQLDDAFLTACIHELQTQTNEVYRYIIAMLLAYSNEERTVASLLVTAETDSSEIIRLDTAMTLQKNGVQDERLVQALTPFMRHGNPVIQEQVTNAIAHMGYDPMNLPSGERSL